MKKIWMLACAVAIGVATTSSTFADVSGSSLDSGTFEFGTPFTSSIVIGPNESISNVTLSINMEHSWIGDISATITHVETGSFVTLMSDVNGDDSSNLGLDPGANDDVLSPGAYTFSDAGFVTIFTAADTGGGSTFEVPIGTYLAEGGLATAFGGESTQGTWRIDFIDDTSDDDGNINGWSINFTSTAIPEPGSMVLLGLFGTACLARRRR